MGSYLKNEKVRKSEWCILDKKRGVYDWIKYEKRRWRYFLFATSAIVTYTSIVNNWLEMITGKNLRNLSFDDYKVLIIFIIVVMITLIGSLIFLCFDYHTYSKHLTNEVVSNLETNLLELKKENDWLVVSFEISITDTKMLGDFLNKNHSIKNRWNSYVHNEKRRMDLEEESIRIEKRRKAVEKMEERNSWETNKEQ